MMSVTSSTAPGTVENSWSTPSILTAVMAAPSMEERRTLRRAFPTVIPKPRSNGWAKNLPNVLLRDSGMNSSRFGR